MKKILVTALMLISFLGFGQSQDNAQKKDEINDIKRNSDCYIFAEATMDEVESAKKLAYDFLAEYVKEWNQKQTESFLISNDMLVENTNYIIIPRGPKYRAFAYVAKPGQTMNPISETVVVVVAGQEPASEPASEPAPSQEQESEQLTAQEAEQESEPEPESVSEPEQDAVASASESAKNQVSDIADSIALPEEYDYLLKKVMNVSTKDQLMNQLYSESMRMRYRYGEIGPQTEQSAVAKAVLVVYSKRTDEIQAILSPKNPDRVNVQSSRKDSTNNYPGCGAIWISAVN